MMLGELEKKRVLILGFGKEGKDTFLFLRKLFPKKTIGIADKNLQLKAYDLKLKNAKWHLGKKYLEAVKNYDVVIKSPGIPFKILPKSALKKIGTQTDIFFENCPGTIIGVTGTKGKSTTASLIYEILKAGKIKAHLIGNIGTPVLSSLLHAKKDDVFVYELSSHQLYNLKPACRQAGNFPHISVFLNIFQEHLDYYKSFKEYAKAKANITLHQTKNDYLVYNKNDKIVTGFAKKSKAKKIPITGEYYALDKNAARAVGRIFKIPKTTIEKAIKKFKSLPHRLELVGTFRGITFYNDALSTIPESAAFAIRQLGRGVETIFLGGYDRNISFQNLARKILKNRNIKNLILFPTTGKKIWNAVLQERDSRGVPNHFFINNMKDAVKIAYKQTGKGKICLLSTASTSFSIFKDYKEKGDLFKKYVKFYAKN